MTDCECKFLFVLKSSTENLGVFLFSHFARISGVKDPKFLGVSSKGFSQNDS